MHDSEIPPTERITTGVPGLDLVLHGGLPASRMYLITGDPGSGKTTLALQFLLEGARNGEPGLYVALSESEEEIQEIARSHGWTLDQVDICALAASEESLSADSQYTLFHPAEIELSETTRTVLDQVDRIRPRRVVFDSLSEMRLLARDPLRYRRQILTLKQYFTSRPCTVLLLDYESTPDGDRQLESLTHGVIHLQQVVPDYGAQRRRLTVQKIRGSTFSGGHHDFNIQKGGLQVFPRLIAAEHPAEVKIEPVSSGIPELDALLGGGFDTGTCTLFLGPAGVGKSTVCAQFVSEAARRSIKSAVYIFDEIPDTFSVRGDALGMHTRGSIRNGYVTLKQIDPAEMSSGEFAWRVQQAVEQHGARVVVIDSLNGYLNAMPEERFLSAHLHELLAYLNQRGVITLLVLAQAGLVGTGIEAPVDLTYLADTVVLLRYFESAGEVHQAISVLKKRSGRHERTIRELRMTPEGIQIGRALREFNGVLSGQLHYTGGAERLLESNGDAPTD